MGVITRTAQKTADSRVGAAFIRWGHVIRGGLYISMGLLAVEWAFGNTLKTPAFSETINLASQNPFGKILLVLIIIGLIGYSGWGLVRLTWEHHFPARLGYLFSAIGYASLILPAIALLTNGKSVSDSGWSLVLWGAGSWIGRIVLVSVGLGVTIGGVMQVKSANKSNWFVKSGIWARAALMALAGIFLLATGWYADPTKPHSFAQVLIAVDRWSFGPVVLGFVGAGLVALGINSLALAKNNEQTQ